MIFGIDVSWDIYGSMAPGNKELFSKKKKKEKAFTLNIQTHLLEFTMLGRVIGIREVVWFSIQTIETHFENTPISE